jgi:hypothetical protein
MNPRDAIGAGVGPGRDGFHECRAGKVQGGAVVRGEPGLRPVGDSTQMPLINLKITDRPLP